MSHVHFVFTMHSIYIHLREVSWLEKINLAANIISASYSTKAPITRMFDPAFQIWAF
jgi:hypothetical protein